MTCFMLSKHQVSMLFVEQPLALPGSANTYKCTTLASCFLSFPHLASAMGQFFLQVLDL
jgi:hypothetical protein